MRDFDIQYGIGPRYVTDQEAVNLPTSVLFKKIAGSIAKSLLGRSGQLLSLEAIERIAHGTIASEAQTLMPREDQKTQKVREVFNTLFGNYERGLKEV